MKLRSRRDTDWEPSNEDFPEALGSQDDRSTGEVRPFEGVEGMGDTGASWLANDVIIGSLPDNKLRDALARYRAIVRLCETELAARALSPRRGTKHHSDVSFMDQYPAYKLPPKADRLPSRRSRNRRGTARSVQPSGLAPEQLLKALEMLLKLKSQKDKPNNDKEKSDLRSERT